MTVTTTRRTGTVAPLAAEPGAATWYPARSHSRRGSEGSGAGFRHVAVGFLFGLILVAGIQLDADSLLLAGALSTLVVAAISPAVGLATLVIVSPLLVVPLLPAPGYPFLLVAATLLGCVYRLPVDRPRLIAPPALLLLGGYVLYVFVQQAPDMLAGYPTSDLRDVGSVMFKLLTGFGAIVAAGYVLRGRSPYPYVAAALASAVLVAVLGIIPTLAPDLGAQLTNLLADPEQTLRQGGSVGNPNYFGNFMAAGAVVTLGWIVISPDARVRLVLLVPLATLLAGLAISQSRGALVTLAAGVIAMAFVRGLRSGLIVTLIAGIAAAIAVPFVITNRVIQQAGTDLAGTFQAQALSDAGRLAAILTGPELFATSPIFGVGLFRYVLEGGTFSHNWFMTVLAEQGIVGILLWLGLIVAVLRWLLRRPSGPRTVGIGLFAVFVVGSMFLEPPLDELTFVLPIVVMVAALVADWGPTRAASRDAVPRPGWADPRPIPAAPPSGRAVSGPARGEGPA